MILSCHDSVNNPLVPAALSAEDWVVVFQETLRFADYQVNRLRWRHDYGGVLPAGFDPNSIAAQAIMDFLQQSPESSQVVSSPSLPEERDGERRPLDSPRSCERFSLSPGERAGVRASLTSTPHPVADPQLGPILWQINRLVLRQVTRLHHLKENWLVSNEADLAPAHDLDGDLVSPLELIPAPDVQPDHALLRKESVLAYHNLKFRFEVFLAKERRLITLFELNCDGISKPQTLAARLKLRVRSIENLQKRLRRRWLAFSKPGSASIPAGEVSLMIPAIGLEKSHKV